MATDYTHRFYMFVTAAKLAAGNNMAAQFDPDAGGDKTFGNIRLSPSGSEPATHYGAATVATDQMRSGILRAFSTVPFVGLYNQADGYEWDTACMAMGLKQIEILIPH